VSADDIVDEMVDELAADVARLGAARISPVLLQRVRVSANMNPEYAHIFEARLAAAVFKAANLALVRCVECTATRSRVEGTEWVVTRGVTTLDDVRAVARKYGARTFLDVALTLREFPASLSMDVEMVRAEDSSIALRRVTDGRGSRDALPGSRPRPVREERLKELEDKLNERPVRRRARAGMMAVKASNSGIFWGGLLRYRLTERFGATKNRAGLALAGFWFGFAGGILGRCGRPGCDGNAFSAASWPRRRRLPDRQRGKHADPGGTVRRQGRDRSRCRSRYMVPFQLRGKGELGGVTRASKFVWNRRAIHAALAGLLRRPPARLVIPEDMRRPLATGQSVAERSAGTRRGRPKAAHRSIHDGYTDDLQT
jgi:hypothetical protein